MAGKKIEIVCTRNNVAYPDVRGAMVAGARTPEDLKEMLEICGECEGCQEHLGYILSTLCGCENVSMKEVQDLVQAGVVDLEEIMDKTKAGKGEDCGRCTGLIESVIKLGH